jgi:RNA polymerase sigma-70 factor, ECF subfamily
MAPDPGVTQDEPEAPERSDVTNDAEKRRTGEMSVSVPAHARTELPVPAVTLGRARPEADAGAEAHAGAAEDFVVAAYETYRRELYSVALSATRDAETAGDLVQEAYLRLVRDVQAGRVPENARAWLYRVVTNLITTRWRRTSVADRFRSLFAVSVAPDDPERDYLRREAASELHIALRTLSVEARVALLLSAQGLSGREVAESIGRSEAATRTMMCRARLTLRERLQDRESHQDLASRQDRRR